MNFFLQLQPSVSYNIHPFCFLSCREDNATTVVMNILENHPNIINQSEQRIIFLNLRYFQNKKIHHGLSFLLIFFPVQDFKNSAIQNQKNAIRLAKCGILLFIFGLFLFETPDLLTWLINFCFQILPILSHQ